MYIYTLKKSSTVFSFCLCRPGFFLSRTSTPNGLNPNNWWVKRINGLLQMNPLTVTWCTVPFKNRKSWTFCLLLKLAIFYFSYMRKLRHLPLHKRRIYRTLTNFSGLPFLLLLPMAKSVHVWPQLDNEVSTWFP